jgi:hypothetical protein
MYTITVPCKKYVRKWLEDPAGKPVDLNKIDQSLYGVFCRLLEKRCTHRDNQLVGVYNDFIHIAVSEDVFNRYGHGLTTTNLTVFNNLLEFMIKERSRTYAKIYGRFGYQRKKAVSDFQKDLKLTDDDFSTDAIIKDIQRHGSRL